MYNYFKGIVTTISPDFTIECNGVGYHIIPTPALSSSVSLGQSATIYIHHDIKETCHTLYGFASIAEREMFRKLVSVSGVGPKCGIALLGMGESNLASAICGQDAKTISKIKGISQKTAEKLIVELRGKISGAKNTDLGFLTPLASGPVAEAIDGLTNLGMTHHSASDLIARLETDGKTAEEIVMMALNVKGGR